MKIVIGSESFIPNISGVSVHAELLAENLASSGHDVFVFAPSRSGKTYFEKSSKGYNILRLRSMPNPFRKGFRVALFPKKAVFSEVLRIKPDIVHLQDPTSICTSLLKAARKNNIPIIITNHFSLEYIISYIRLLKPFHAQIRKILMMYLSNFYNKTNYVFCPTETIKKELLSWGVKTPIEAISNGVDLERFFSYSSPSTIRLKYHLPINPIVLYVGRINVDKNIKVLINAMPEVLKETDAHFVLVGGGDDLPKMKRMAQKLGIMREVTFLGPIDYKSQDLPQIYQIASLFAISSPIETQSIVTLEAMASGLPIVAANAGALPELVKNNQNGYLFDPKSSEEMAKKMIKILKNESHSSKMKINSLKSVSKHQIEECFAKITKKYDEVCAAFKK